MAWDPARTLIEEGLEIERAGRRIEHVDLNVRFWPKRDAIVRILLVEDDNKVLRHLASGLREAGHAVECARDGSEACRAVEHRAHDVLVLDIMMPQLVSITLLRGLRGRSLEVPLLFISARGADPAAGVHAGADDGRANPFCLDELLTQLQSLTAVTTKEEARA